MKLARGKHHKVRPGNRAMTVEESARVDKVKRSGCGPCMDRGYYQNDESEEAPAVEAHHLLDDGGLRRGHAFTVGLCLWHHRNRTFVDGWSIADHRLRLGPNLEQEADAFHKSFGSDDELLRMQNERLEGGAL